MPAGRTTTNESGSKGSKVSGRVPGGHHRWSTMHAILPPTLGHHECNATRTWQCRQFRSHMNLWVASKGSSGSPGPDWAPSDSDSASSLAVAAVWGNRSEVPIIQLPEGPGDPDADEDMDLHRHRAQAAQHLQRRLPRAPRRHLKTEGRDSSPRIPAVGRVPPGVGVVASPAAAHGASVSGLLRVDRDVHAAAAAPLGRTGTERGGPRSDEPARDEG